MRIKGDPCHKLAKARHPHDVPEAHPICQDEEIAMAGGSDAEIMSRLEHATDRGAKIYRRQADWRRMADGAQDRVDKVVSLREARKKRDAPSKA